MSPSINKEKIKDLIDADPSKELIIQLIEIFNVEMIKAIKQIKIDLENENFSAASQLAHRMRSTSLNLGATNLGELFRQLEYLNYQKTPITEISSIVLQIENFYNSASQELKEYT